ncbi:MAG: glycyl-radical enzyme activating protein [Coprobacillaceae bacterium]
MSDSGIIFNIQKFSIHDGPGIRTTVFLKGCPLRCIWCSNPESQAFDIEITWDKTKCIHCLNCVQSCSNNAIKHIDNAIHVDNKKVSDCFNAVNTCPTHALNYEGEYKSVNDIVSVCMQDRDFYEESNGGVTISGGEGMGQPAFLKVLVEHLKAENLHVAIETTGYVAPTIFQDLAPRFDLLLFDIKHYNSKKHELGTNVPNERIVENLKLAVNHNINILPRIPIIPSFNDSLEDAKGLATLLIDVGIKSVQLLPFHQFGEKKYELLHMYYKYKDVKALYPEDLKDYQQIFIDQGLDCFF